MSRLVRAWNIVFLVVGVVALTITVLLAGPATLWAGVTRLGAAFLLSCLVHGLGVALDGLVLAGCLVDHVDAKVVGKSIRASFAGHGINTATPLGNVGELTKYQMLARDHAHEDVAAALVLQNLYFFGSNVAFLTVVPLASVIVLDVGRAAATVLLLCAAVFAVLGGALAFVVRRGTGDWPFRLLRRLRVRADRVERARAFWHKTEAAARRRGKGRRRIAALFAISMASRLAGALEAFIILAAIGPAPHPLVACLTLANGQVTTWLTSFVPFQAGTAEGAGWLLFRGLALDPRDGIFLELVKKARRVVYFLVGIAVLGRGVVPPRPVRQRSASPARS